MRPTAEATVVLTGATSGIGQAAAYRFAPLVRRLVLHGPEPADAVAPMIADLGRTGRAEVSYLPADYGNLANVVRLVSMLEDRVAEIDVLVNNAARPGAARRVVSENGYEATLQTNYLAPALLTDLLAPQLSRSAARVVHVGSATHESATLDLADMNLEHGPYDPAAAYARSKLALVADSLWRARQGGDATFVSIHPGVIATELLHAMFAIHGSSPDHGAANIVAAATDPTIASGTYVDDGTVGRASARARDRSFQDALREITLEMLRPWRATDDANAPGLTGSSRD